MCACVKTYCKFGNFRENFIFANSVKTHVFDVENLRQGRDLLNISVNDRVISPILEDTICEASRK